MEWLTKCSKWGTCTESHVIVNQVPVQWGIQARHRGGASDGREEDLPNCNNTHHSFTFYCARSGS